MRAKFYKGPMHGKTKDINPRQIVHGRVLVNIMRSRRDMLVQPAGMSIGVPLNFTVAEYQIKMMHVKMDNRDYYAPAMHPDGSIFVEFVKEKK